MIQAPLYLSDVAFSLTSRESIRKAMATVSQSGGRQGVPSKGGRYRGIMSKIMGNVSQVCLIARQGWLADQPSDPVGRIARIRRGWSAIL